MYTNQKQNYKKPGNNPRPTIDSLIFFFFFLNDRPPPELPPFPPPAPLPISLSGRDPQLVVIVEPKTPSDPPTAAGDDASARITLRLAEALKTAVEAAANREQVSTNTWIVRTLGRALEQRPTRVRTGNRLQGFAQS